MIAAAGQAGESAYTRDLMLDGERRFDLRTTVAWVEGVGLSVWAYYGLEAMEMPKRVFHLMLRANYEYPFVKFALTDDDRPMLVAELPGAGLDRNALGRALTAITVVADRLLEETASAVADRGELPDWTGRVARNPELLRTYRAEVESTMPTFEPPPPRPPRRSRVARLFDRYR